MFRGIFSQIVVVALGVAIIALYIEPLLGEIGDTQDEIADYRIEREKVESVNNRLFALDQQINLIPFDDQAAVRRFLPDDTEIDTIAIPRDIEFIMEEADVEYEQVTMGKNSGNTTSERGSKTTDWVSPHSINIGLAGSYEEIKNFFDLLPSNEYPLEIIELAFKPDTASDELKVTGELRTYSYLEIVD